MYASEIELSGVAGVRDGGTPLFQAGIRARSCVFLSRGRALKVNWTCECWRRGKIAVAGKFVFEWRGRVLCKVWIIF